MRTVDVPYAKRLLQKHANAFYIQASGLGRCTFEMRARRDGATWIFEDLASVRDWIAKESRILAGELSIEATGSDGTDRRKQSRQGWVRGAIQADLLS